MKKKDNRERVLQVRLSQEEFDAIERKFRNRFAVKADVETGQLF